MDFPPRYAGIHESKNEDVISGEEEEEDGISGIIRLRMVVVASQPFLVH